LVAVAAAVWERLGRTEFMQTQNLRKHATKLPHPPPPITPCFSLFRLTQASLPWFSRSSPVAKPTARMLSITRLSNHAVEVTLEKMNHASLSIANTNNGDHDDDDANNNNDGHGAEK
jgi:hypothetical protein